MKKTIQHRFLFLCIAMHACLIAGPTQAAGQNENGLTAQELAAEAPVGAGASISSVSEKSVVKVSLSAEGMYPNARDDQRVDVLEQDYIYISAKLETQSGVAVVGVVPELEISGSSRIMRLPETTSGQATDAEGLFEFAVIGGSMGLHRLRVTAEGARADLEINVISLDAAGFASPDSVEGALPWRELTQAKVRYTDNGGVQADIPPAIQAKNGKRVKIAGFMVPLEAESKQKHFLLASNPPTCFFHTPGGPAGAIEVFSDAGVEANWELVVMEGRLEALEASDNGTVYRLHGAVVVDESE